MTLWNDLRFGARTLRKSPGFALTAIVTLALGIGATTAIYSVCDGLLWKPVPLPHLETLAIVLQRVPNAPDNWNDAAPADIEDIRHGNSSFESLAMWQEGMANIVGTGGEPERALQALVSANFFDVVGVQPARGRGFQAGEDQPGREREVILSDGLWRRRFGADPSVVGKTIRLDDQNFVVTGIMPAKYDFPQAAELWTPMALTPEERTSRRGTSVIAVSRLKPGRTIEQAAAETASVAARLAKAYPDTNKGRGFLVWPAQRFLVEGETRQYLLMLLGAVIFVLLIS